jgi:polyribonucleotide nucleotidyltransferase
MASAAVAEEASSSGPAKFSVRIPVGDREVSASELHPPHEL